MILTVSFSSKLLMKLYHIQKKEKNYDENVGLFSPIKSKTVSLTTTNYKR